MLLFIVIYYTETFNEMAVAVLCGLCHRPPAPPEYLCQKKKDIFLCISNPDLYGCGKSDLTSHPLGRWLAKTKQTWLLLSVVAPILACQHPQK